MAIYTRDVSIDNGHGYMVHQPHAVRGPDEECYSVISHGAHPRISGLAVCLRPWAGGRDVNVPAVEVEGYGQAGQAGR